MDSNLECDHQLNSILESLNKAELILYKDGPAGVHLWFKMNALLAEGIIEIFACGWMGLKKKNEGGILLCEGSNYILREGMLKLPVGQTVESINRFDGGFAFKLVFSNGDQLGFKPWQDESIEYPNSLHIWSGEPYDSVSLMGVYTYPSKLEPATDIGRQHRKKRKSDEK